MALERLRTKRSRRWGRQNTEPAASCFAPCTGDTVRCGATCNNPQTDAANCGACGAARISRCAGGCCRTEMTLFSDGFETGTTSWTLDPTCSRVTMGFAGMHGLFATPPIPRFPEACGVSGRAVMNREISLADVASATVRFRALIAIGSDDTIEVLGSDNGGSTWTSLGSIGASSTWAPYTVDLSRFAGRPTVRVGSRFANPCPDCCTATMRLDEVEIRGT